MPFDVKGALESGYSEAEIADYLASQSKFDAAGARATGYTDAEIISHLSPTKPTGAEWSKNVDPSLYNKSDERSKAALRMLREGARQVGLTGRTIMDTFAAPPLAAADTGIALRNAAQGSIPWLPGGSTREDAPAPYQSASQMWNEALNSAGVPDRQTVIEKGVNVAGQMLLGSKMPAPQASQAAPAAFNPQAMRAVALKRAQDAGLKVPPSTTNPTLFNRFLESWGGKHATAQDFSRANQPKIDALVKGDLGLKAMDDVAEGTLPTLRAEAAAKGYTPVKSVGTIRLDSSYGQALDDIAAPYVKAQAGFPGLVKNDIADTVTALKQKSVDSSTAIDSLQILRDKADVAYRAGDGSLGKAYKSMAKALEDAIERSLVRRGANGKQMLAEFRNARQIIAKTHSAQKALNPELGMFDAGKLAQQLDQGKPLSGGMKKVGQASQAFKEAMRLRTDSPGVSNIDAAFGMGTAALSGNPLPLLYPFSRVAARDFMLSPMGQRLATPASQYGLPPDLVMGATRGLLGP